MSLSSSGLGQHRMSWQKIGIVSTLNQVLKVGAVHYVPGLHQTGAMLVFGGQRVFSPPLEIVTRNCD